MTDEQKKYWKERAEEWRKQRLASEKEAAAQRNATYLYHMDKIDEQIDTWLAKYASKRGMTMAEARQAVKTTDIHKYEEEAARLSARGAAMRKEGQKVTYAKFSDEANERMALYNLTMKINRLEYLKSLYGLQLVDMTQEVQNSMGEELDNWARECQRRQAGILGEYTRPDGREAETIADADFHGARWSERLWQEQDRLKAALDVGLSQILLRGGSSRDVEKAIKKMLESEGEKSKYVIHRLAVTESSRIYTEVQRNSYNSTGYKSYVFLNLGPHPCDVCKTMDGEVYKVKDMQPGENAPPMHPLCRCDTAPAMTDEDFRRFINGQDSE